MIVTAKGTECKSDKPHWTNPGEIKVTEINGRRYTMCSHPVGHTFCGALIDVTDLPSVVVCCGDEHNHMVEGRGW